MADYLLDECQHDPPCGAAHCSACEIQRKDQRIRELERELEKRKRLQPCDRDGKPITQGIANGMMAGLDQLAAAERLNADAASVLRLVVNTAVKEGKTIAIVFRPRMWGFIKGVLKRLDAQAREGER